MLFWFRCSSVSTESPGCRMARIIENTCNAAIPKDLGDPAAAPTKNWGLHVNEVNAPRSLASPIWLSRDAEFTNCVWLQHIRVFGPNGMDSRRGPAKVRDFRDAQSEKSLNAVFLRWIRAIQEK